MQILKLQLFCIYTKWEDKIEVQLADDNNVKSVSLLGYGKELNWSVKGNTLTVEIPKLTIDEIPCLEAWTLKILFEMIKTESQDL